MIARARDSRSAIGAGCRAFNGLAGVTSHHTRSSRIRFNASRVMYTCPSCAGSNDPPRRPTTMPRVAIGMRFIGSNAERFSRSAPADS